MRPIPQSLSTLQRLALLGLAWCCIPLASATDMNIIDQPYDFTTVSGNDGVFKVRGGVPGKGGRITGWQWYANGVAISGATAQTLVVAGSASTNGVRYHCVIQGQDQDGNPVGPTASSQATLTVLPAGTPLPPRVLVPADGSQVVVDTSLTFQAQGLGLTWNFDIEGDANPAGQMDLYYNGLQRARLYLSYPPAGERWTRLAIQVVGSSGDHTAHYPINAPNRPPKVSSDSYGPVWPGYTLTVDAAHGVLGNDTDPDGDPLTAILLSTPAYGTLTFNADGSFVYVTDPDPAGKSVSFNYKVSDGRGGEARSYVGITVPRSPADVNHDGVVNAVDVEIVTSGFGQQYP